MPEFAYTARTSSGQLTDGTLSAESVAEALRKLRQEGKYPVSVTQAERAQREETVAVPEHGIRVSRSEVIHFSTQLATMIETGVTLAEALECIAKQSEKPRIRAMVSDIDDRVQGGASLSEALAHHPRSFPSLYVALIRASEKSGLMARMLNRATAYLRDEQETRRKVLGAMVYPGVMFGFVILVTTFLLTFVMPRFTAIYRMKNAALPTPTRVLMNTSDFLINQWPALLIGIALTVVGVILALRTDAGRRAWHSVQLHVPLFGGLYKKLHLSRGLRVVGTMAGAGVALMDCVSVAQDLCPNGYFRDLWKRIADQIQAGRQLSEPLFDSPLVPRSVAQMISSGEKGGKLAQVMEQISAYAEAELKEQVAALTRYIEPAMIVFMGIIIGGLCLALLLPIFTISKVISQ